MTERVIIDNMQFGFRGEDVIFIGRQVQKST